MLIAKLSPKWTHVVGVEQQGAAELGLDMVRIKDDRFCQGCRWYVVIQCT